MYTVPIMEKFVERAKAVCEPTPGYRSYRTAKTAVLVALNCQTFSLGRVLIDYAFGPAIRIAYSNLDGGDQDNQDGVCRVV